MSHDVVVIESPMGWMAMCDTCGWRATKWHKESAYAQEEADSHEMDAKYVRLNSGPRPSAATAVRIYRKNAETPTFTPSEREMWRQLADELEIELAARAKGPLEGQMELF